ncbi:MAG: SDR family oxidoreductase [Flavobacteriales bacterium]|mgnify:FL=1|nr:SDR family oxidoreductase [Flavobacteriales bacterium]MBT6745873.1 SDR family oxidoreductase [Flavobacteriales bacterium]
MTNILEGKKGIIFGALDAKSIAWKVAERANEEGAKFVLTNAPVALRMGTIKELGEKCNADIIGADATSVEDLTNLIDQSQEILGGKLDFVLHSIGMSPNVRKGRHYTDLNYDWYHKSLDISAMSFHKLLQVAMEKDAINEWGSVVGLTYIAAQRVFPDYGDMADAKSMLESIARSFGYHYGVKNKVRINTISQSPTATTAGTGVKGFDDFISFADSMSPLGNADALACADYCISMFSDLTRYVTMQNLMHDGGFSNTGVSAALMEKMKG